VRAWRPLLRREDDIALIAGDVFVSLSGCLSTDATFLIRRFQLSTSDTRWSAGIAIWDHEEPENELLQRALDAATRAYASPGSIVMAAASVSRPAMA